MLVAACLLPTSVFAQAPAGAPAPPPSAKPVAAADLESLVARVALYPDDLLAIMLPAATTPLDLVKAQRFLDKRKSDPNLKPDPALAPVPRPRPRASADRTAGPGAAPPVVAMVAADNGE